MSQSAEQFGQYRHSITSFDLHWFGFVQFRGGLPDPFCSASSFFPAEIWNPPPCMLHPTPFPSLARPPGDMDTYGADCFQAQAKHVLGDDTGMAVWSAVNAAFRSGAPPPNSRSISLTDAFHKILMLDPGTHNFSQMRATCRVVCFFRIGPDWRIWIGSGYPPPIRHLSNLNRMQ